MKRVINLLFVLGLLTFTFPVLAQDDYQVEPQGSQRVENDLSAVALRKTHRDNWFVSLGASGDIMFGEQDQYVSPLKRIRLGGEFSVGKWFNPNFGIGLNILGGGLRGFNDVGAPYETGYYTTPSGHIYGTGAPFFSTGFPMGGSFFLDANGNPIPKYTTAQSGGTWNPKYPQAKGQNGSRLGFYQDFNFVTPTLNVMANITNLFRGYAVDNGWFELVGFAGVGPNFAFDNGYSNPNFWSIAGRIGLRSNFNINKNWAVYLQAASYITDPEFDGYKGTAMIDMYTNVGLGIQYTFNRNVSSFESMTIDELDRLNNRVNENRSLIDNHQDILERQQRLLDKLKDCCDQKPVTIIQKEEAAKALPGYVRFALDSYVIEKFEYSKILDAVDYLKNNPNAKILLVGYADRQTGNPPYNFNLSKKRVDAVKAEIIKQGINDNRISTEWKGDKEQPFGVNEWNRVVMMIEKR